jgi:diguanylate cyclase (GGDEF)-like protein
VIEAEDGAPAVLSVVEDITETKRHEARMRFDVLHDPLTQLPNRTLLLDRLDQALHDATESRQLVAVLHCDVDHLRVVNEVHGHAVGDDYLRAVARRIESALRDHDMVGRLGGDEFLVILPMTKPSEAQVFVGRVQASLRELEQAHPEFGACTLSMGVAESPRHGTTVSSLLAAADSALYKAKRGGRNTVEVADN